MGPNPPPPPSSALAGNAAINPNTSQPQSVRKRNGASPTPSAVSSASSGRLSTAILAGGGNCPKLLGGGCPAPAVQLSSLNGTKFGAASPHAVKKLLALSEASKTRPKVSPTGSGPGSGVNPSPLALRRGAGQQSTVCSSPPQTAQTQSSHANVNPTGLSPVPVDLTAESSSVSSLRKVQNTGSVTSTDSGLGFYDICSSSQFSQPGARRSTTVDFPPHPPRPASSSGGKIHLTSSSSIKEQRRHQAILNQRHHRSKNSSGGNRVTVGNAVSLHHAVPVEIRSSSSSVSSASTAAAGTTGPGSSSGSNIISIGGGGAKSKSMPYYVTPPTEMDPHDIPHHHIHEDDDDDETQVSAV